MTEQTAAGTLHILAKELAKRKHESGSLFTSIDTMASTIKETGNTTLMPHLNALHSIANLAVQEYFSEAAAKANIPGIICSARDAYRAAYGRDGAFETAADTALQVCQPLQKALEAAQQETARKRVWPAYARTRDQIDARKLSYEAIVHKGRELAHTAKWIGNGGTVMAVGIKPGHRAVATYLEASGVPTTGDKALTVEGPVHLQALAHAGISFPGADRYKSGGYLNPQATLSR